SDAVVAAANGTYLLSLTAEVVALSAPDQSRLRSKDPAGFSSSAPRAFWCTRRDGCMCPDGSAHSGESPLPMLPPGRYYFTVPGALEGSEWSVEGISLSDYCNDPR